MYSSAAPGAVPALFSSSRTFYEVCKGKKGKSIFILSLHIYWIDKDAK